MLARSRFVCVLLLVGLASLARCQGEEPKATLPAEGRGVPIMGRVLWPEHDLARTQVRVYSDPERKTLVDSFPTGGPKGGVVFALDPGTYYLMVFSDQDGDSKASPGDGLGFYGVTDVKARPRPLVVDAGAAVITITIAIAFRIAPDGKSLEPLAMEAPTPYAAESEVPLSGEVTGLLDPEAERFVLLVPLASNHGCTAASALLDITGRRVLELHPGANGAASLAPGVYFVRKGTDAEIQKVVLLE